MSTKIKSPPTSELLQIVLPGITIRRTRFRLAREAIVLSTMALLLWPASGSAADWQRYGSTRRGDPMFYDAASIRRTGSKAWIWTRTNYPSGKADPRFTQPVRSTMIRSLVACDRDEWSVLWEVQYTDQDGRGTMLLSEEFPEEIQKWAPGPPGTAAGNLVSIACGR